MAKKKTSSTSQASKSTCKVPITGSHDKAQKNDYVSKSRRRNLRRRMAKKSSGNEKSAKDVTTPSVEKTINVKQNEKSAKDVTTPSVEKNINVKHESSLGGKKMSALQRQFLEKLSGSRFRIINEELYTTTSSVALKNFREDPDLFRQYHEGFRKQVESWPVNPLEIMFNSILSIERKKRRQIDTKICIADFGCGDAKLACRLLQIKNGTECPFIVHSLDLVANGNELITPCDMANTSLQTASVDVGVFCLALMGINIADFIREAHRVLKKDGILKIAEVRSRFEGSSDGEKYGKQYGKEGKKKIKAKQADTRVFDQFIEVMVKLGFRMLRTDKSNTMFMFIDFVKNERKPSKEVTFSAKPCIYKRR